MICAFCENEPASIVAHKSGIEYGQKVERERIIALLTPIRQRFMGKGLEEEIVADTLGEVIALIKGERTKEEQIADLMWLSEQQLIAENKRKGENK